MVDGRSEKGDEVGTINKDSVWGPDEVKSCSSPPWMWYALTLAIVYRSLGSWCPAMFACLVYGLSRLNGPKGVRGQLWRGQGDFNMAHSCFLHKPTSSSLLEGAMLFCATLWLTASPRVPTCGNGA